MLPLLSTKDVNYIHRTVHTYFFSCLCFPGKADTNTKEWLLPQFMCKALSGSKGMSPIYMYSESLQYVSSEGIPEPCSFLVFTQIPVREIYVNYLHLYHSFVMFIGSLMCNISYLLQPFQSLSSRQSSREADYYGYPW